MRTKTPDHRAVKDLALGQHTISARFGFLTGFFGDDLAGHLRRSGLPIDQGFPANSPLPPNRGIISAYSSSAESGVANVGTKYGTANKYLVSMARVPSESRKHIVQKTTLNPEIPLLQRLVSAQFLRCSIPNHPTLLHDVVAIGDLRQGGHVLVDHDDTLFRALEVGETGPYLLPNQRGQPLGSFIEN